MEPFFGHFLFENKKRREKSERKLIANKSCVYKTRCNSSKNFYIFYIYKTRIQAKSLKLNVLL